MTDDAAEPGRDTHPFRVAFAPGVTPGKWARTWERRLPGSRSSSCRPLPRTSSGCCTTGAPT